MLLSSLLAVSLGLANPHPDPDLVPLDPVGFVEGSVRLLSETEERRLLAEGVEVLRVQVDWSEASGAYRLGELVRERSGTEALVRKAARPDALGSFKGMLLDSSGVAISHDAVGTGQEFRRLTRALTFRFPVPARPVTFELVAENPSTGVLERVLSAPIDPAAARVPPAASVTIGLVHEATVLPKLALNVYAEGYLAGRAGQFWADVARIPAALRAAGFPMLDRLEIRGVFADSNLRMGQAADLGFPIPERDTFLGLYFPYWRNFGRWYHVVYPTREERYRRALGQVPYDYPAALIDSGEYWGVGNYMELTAVPASSGRFAYLFTHELGHFFGLNEEYDSGGATELAFAPGISEPWSQNITFHAGSRAALKWNAHVHAATPVPTPANVWNSSTPKYGAYRGGYGQTEPLRRSHKPGLGCVMDRYARFCPVCREAIEGRIRYALGE